MKLAYFLWLLPFSFFLAGYLITAHFAHVPSCETPSCIGQSTHQALQTLSSQGLSAKILEEQEDDALEPGTIIDQRPIAGQKIKHNQIVYLIVSTARKKTPAPLLLGLAPDIVAEQLKEMGVSYKNYSVPGTALHDTCIAQAPAAGTPLDEKKIITYSVAAPENLVIFPDFTGKLAHECIAFLEQHTIKPHISHNQEPAKQHVCRQCTVIDQKPLAGSLVLFDANLQVQIHIEHKM